VYEPRLRYPLPRDLPRKVAGQRIVRVGRRAKYLLLGLESGTLLLHLGMSGNLRVVPAATPRVPHDHFDLVLDSGRALRFNDPRRFGSLVYTSGEAGAHPLLERLGPEPFSKAFDADYLYRITRRRRVAIKQLLMNSQLVVGVGNIYASEALFRARLRPGRAARSLTRADAARLVRAVRRAPGARCCARRSALAARPCATISGPTVRPAISASASTSMSGAASRAGAAAARCGP